MVFNEHLQTYSNKSGENMAKLHQVYERELGLDKPFKPKLNHKRNSVYEIIFIWENVSTGQKFHTGKVPPGPDKTPSIDSLLRILSSKKRKIFLANIYIIGLKPRRLELSLTHINTSKSPKNILRILDVSNYYYLSHRKKEEN